MQLVLSSIAIQLACTLLFTTSVQAGGSAEDHEYGEELYDLSCANCHGENMNSTGISSFNLRDFPLKEKERFIESVTMGKGFMPSFGKILDKEEIQQLWVYISSNHN